MFAIDYKVIRLDVEHRRSLLTLLKLEYDIFEPCYVKIPPFNRMFGSSHGLHCDKVVGETVLLKSLQLDNPFGIFSIVRESQLKLSNSKRENCAGSQILKIEIYHDRESLELICYGKISLFNCEDITSDLSEKDDDYRNDILVQSTTFLQLQSIQKVTVPLFHVSKGDFHLPAGSIQIAIRLYRIDVARCLDYDIATFPPSCCQIVETEGDAIAPSVAQPQQLASGISPVINVYSMQDISLRDSALDEVNMRDIHTSYPDSSPLNSASPPESILHAVDSVEYDSVDEFVSSFRARSSNRVADAAFRNHDDVELQVTPLIPDCENELQLLIKPRQHSMVKQSRAKIKTKSKQRKPSSIYSRVI